MRSNPAVLSELNAAQLREIIKAIDAETDRLGILPCDLVVAVRIDGEGNLAAVDVRMHVSRGALWSYDPAHQVRDACVELLA